MGAFGHVVERVEAHPILSGVRYDVLADRPVLANGAEVSPQLVAELRLIAEQRRLNVGKELATDAIVHVARRREFDAPVEPLMLLPPWDGRLRLDWWLVRYAGAADTGVTRHIGRWWLISAIARAFDPGCVVKYVLNIQGPQDAGKSTLLRKLAGERFYLPMTKKAIGSRDTKAELAGKWIAEFPDLGELPKSEMNAVKAFISDPFDNYTRKYEKFPVDVKRRCVFAITENPDGGGWVNDTTGAVRFWPVLCGEIDIAAFEEDRAQLLAEAMAAYRSGSRWWPTRDDDPRVLQDLRDLQEGLQIGDPWLDILRQALREKKQTATSEVLRAILAIDPGRQTRGDEMRVAKLLKMLGFQRVRESSSGLTPRPWIYVR